MPQPGALEIQLPRGLVALVDADDFDWLSEWKWNSNASGYVGRRVDRKWLAMHRLIMGAQPGQVVDHINHIPWDNRRANLRLCTPGENARNRKLSSRTGFLGVFKLGEGRYRGAVAVNGRQRHTACFFTAIGAALARDVLARQLHGEFASLNFPDLEFDWEWKPGSRPHARRQIHALLKAVAA